MHYGVCQNVDISIFLCIINFPLWLKKKQFLKGSFCFNSIKNFLNHFWFGWNFQFWVWMKLSISSLDEIINFESRWNTAKYKFSTPLSQAVLKIWGARAKISVWSKIPWKLKISRLPYFKIQYMPFYYTYPGFKQRIRQNKE